MLYRFGECELDTGQFELQRSGRAVELEPQVFELLVYLIAHRDRVVSRRELHDRVWHGRIVTDAALNSRIKAARAAVGDDGDLQLIIRTLHRTGYRFVAEVIEVSAMVPAPAPPPASGTPVLQPPQAAVMADSRQRRAERSRIWMLVAALFALAGLLGWWWQRPGTVSRTDESVAVLPFKDLSAVADQAPIAAGTTVEILARLRLVDQLTVAGGDWMAKLVADSGSDLRSLGERLSVHYLLEGDVRTEGERLRIGARLVDVADGHIAWSQQYDRDKRNLFDVQDDIAQQVAGALSVTLNVGLHAARNGGTRNYQAYEHFLLGRSSRNLGPPMRAVAELEQAVALDPAYARAWAELAIAYGTVARLARTTEEMAPPLGKMDAASAKAIALAPQMWFGHANRGWYYIARNDWLNAEASLRRASALDDGRDPDLYAMMGAFASQVGRATVTQQKLEQVQRLDPRANDIRVSMQTNAVVKRDFAAARGLYEDLLRSPSGNMALSHQLAFWAAMAEARMDQVRVIAEELKVSSPRRYDAYLANLGNAQAILDEARRVVTLPNPGRQAFETAALMAGQYGDSELAVRALRRGFLGPGWAGYFNFWLPQLREARKTQAFKDFVRDVGFVAMWRASGDWGDFCHPMGTDDFECF